MFVVNKSPVVHGLFALLAGLLTIRALWPQGKAMGDR
jgi:hypothetical protein